jgi:FAD dependent oxidoreductase
MRWEGLLEFASRQTSFSSSGRIVIVGPIHRKCPGVVVVAVNKIAERCKQATESLSSDRSRDDTSHAIIRSDRCRAGWQFLHWFELQTNPERFSKDCPVFIWEVNRKSILYGFPLVGDLRAGLKVANEESEGIVDPDSVDRIVSDADKVKMYETYVRPFLPDLGPRSIKTAVCLYTNAPGARFVIDTHPEHERVIFASPCSGHGFKHSAAIGEALADRLRNRPLKVDLSPFDLRHLTQFI